MDCGGRDSGQWNKGRGRERWQPGPELGERSTGRRRSAAGPVSPDLQTLHPRLRRQRFL